MRTLIKGFTLVELAIVLVIIGLLVGGILAGQELIEQAKIRSDIRLINEYDTAINTFRAKYNNALPGDFNHAIEFGIGQNMAQVCAHSVCTTAGDGNGILESEPGSLLVTRFAGEIKNTFVMLANAKLVKGNFSQQVSNTELNNAFPELATGGGMLILSAYDKIYYAFGFDSTTYDDSAIDEGIVVGDPTALVLTPAQAYAIDSKLDNGNPTSGSVQSYSSYNSAIKTPNFSGHGNQFNCSNTDINNDTSANYTLTTTEKACMLRIKASS